MPAKQKLNFKINVREIGFGFLVCIEDQHEVVNDEIWCEDNDSIIDQIRTWIDEIFEKKEKT